MELKYFLDLWERAKKEGRDGPILIPLFYALQVEECKNHDLAEKYHKEFALGGAFKNKRLTEICTAMEALDELTRYAGVRNDGNLKGEEFAYMTAERIGAILKKGMAAGPSKDMIL